MTQFSTFPEPLSFNGSEPDPYTAEDRARAFADEDARAERWARFEGECADFAREEPDGWAAVLRCLASVMARQPELFK